MSTRSKQWINNIKKKSDERRSARRRRNPRPPKFRKVYLLPNLITSASLISGMIAVFMAFEGEIVVSAWLVLISICLDGMDGQVARMTHSTSQFGVNYDSLSDLVAFGVAPATIIYQRLMESAGKEAMYSAAIYVVCAALRLARFNVQVRDEEKNDFTGIPTPAAAALMVTSILMAEKYAFAKVIQIGLPILAVLLAVLMITKIRYPSFKSLKLERRKPLHDLVAIILIIFLFVVYHEYYRESLFFISLIYVIIGPLWAGERTIARNIVKIKEAKQNRLQNTTEK